jgi:hypothetical protein
MENGWRNSLSGTSLQTFAQWRRMALGDEPNGDEVAAIPTAGIGCAALGAFTVLDGAFKNSPGLFNLARQPDHCRESQHRCLACGWWHGSALQEGGMANTLHLPERAAWPSCCLHVGPAPTSPPMMGWPMGESAGVWPI